MLSAEAIHVTQYFRRGMPIFTFKCLLCGAVIELIVKPNVNATICEECGDVALKVLSVPSPPQWGCKRF
jgi:predicted nucleic acid-binding Zn ribbon protein